MITADEAGEIIADSVSSANLVRECTLALREQLTEAEAQHCRLAEQMEEAMAAVGVLCNATGDMVEASRSLEHMYRRIDDLAVVLDSVNEKIAIIERALYDMKGDSVPLKAKAVSLFRAVTKKETARDQAFARIPRVVLLDGSSPLEYSTRFKGVIAELSSMAPLDS